MNEVQSLLDKITDIYYPNYKYPLPNNPKKSSVGLCDIDKLSVQISTNHLKTKNYITIIANESIFKCITNYLCKEQVFIITDSKPHNDTQSTYLVVSKHIKSQNNYKIKSNTIQSESPFINLIDIINIPINIIINDNEDIFDTLLNSTFIFVYYPPSYNDKLLDYIDRITQFKISIGIYTSKDNYNQLIKIMKARSLFDEVKFIKPLTLPSELELIEYLLDYHGNDDFRNFYKNLFKVEIGNSDNNMSNMISEIDIIMKNKCKRCYKRLENDIKSLKSPHSINEMYRKKVEYSIIGSVIILSMLHKLFNNKKIILSRLLGILVDNILFKMIYYMTLCYILFLCVKYTDREFFRQSEESVSRYLNGAENKLKLLKENYNFI